MQPNPYRDAAQTVLLVEDNANHMLLQQAMRKAQWANPVQTDVVGGWQPKLLYPTNVNQTHDSYSRD